jgi:hypothetical protein
MRSTTSETRLERNLIVNIQKHMEVIFVAILAAVGLVRFLLNDLPDAVAKPQPPVARNIATPTSMAVVIVRAPRPRGN